MGFPSTPRSVTLDDLERCLSVSPKPDSPKLGLGVGVFQIRRNPFRRN